MRSLIIRKTMISIIGMDNIVPTVSNVMFPDIINKKFVNRIKMVNPIFLTISISSIKIPNDLTYFPFPIKLRKLNVITGSILLNL